MSQLEAKTVEITEDEQKKKIKRNEDNLRDFWDIIKCTNICIIGVSEGGERERERKGQRT